MLPGTVQARLRASCDHVPVWAKIPSPKIVMLATECSKPEATKASSAHHRTMSLAESLRVRVAIHSARQTSMLQSTERQKSCGPVAASLALTRLAIIAAPGPGTPGLALVASVPPALTSQANPSEPR